MADKGKLELKLTDVFGGRIRELVTVNLRHMEFSERRVAKGLNAAGLIRIGGLRQVPRGQYRVTVTPPSYTPVGRFVNIPASGAAQWQAALPVDPDNVEDVTFPSYGRLSQALRDLLGRSNNVLGFEGLSGRPLYEELDDIRRAGLLNIAAKCLVTPLADETVVLPRIEEIYELRGDRFFAKVPKTLREETKNSVQNRLFDKADESLHHPPEGFSNAGSFKTPDDYGNLQLSFFMNGDETRADIDIDDAAGFAHVFQVLRNWLSGRPTHPYDIGQILFKHQSVDPGYRFVV